MGRSTTQSARGLLFITAALLYLHFHGNTKQSSYCGCIMMAICCCTGVEGLMVDVVVPPQVASINGSDDNMGCASTIERGSVTVCDCTSLSYLVDGVSPDIDTSTSDWASQLVTVRRNEGTNAVPFAHALLTFGFDTAVSLTRIEMDLFLCPDWGIGASVITVYYNEDYDLAFNIIDLPLARSERVSQISCDSLSTVTITRDTLTNANHVLHILVELNDIQWVHIAEVRFLNNILLSGTLTNSTSLQFTVFLLSFSVSRDDYHHNCDPLINLSDCYLLHYYTHFDSQSHYNCHCVLHISQHHIH